jgi:flagellar assembly protein FliH
MTNSSKRQARQVPPPPGAKPSVYARFIPREELSAFSAWLPDSLSGQAYGTAQADVAAEPPTEQHTAALQTARQSGYQDGYRDGLVALEAFKQSFAQQMTTQLGTLMRGFNEQIDALEDQMAQALAHAAMDLAGQVVRHELSARPELVASVAREAVASLLLSARHIAVRVHPDDHTLVAQGAGDELERRGARLVADAAVSRGGCVVESDVGVIDARIENLWRRAAAALGGEDEWNEDRGT